MVLPQSGNPISLLNLQLEYDDTAPTSLNEFYGQAQAPASGTIDLADFYAPASTAAVTNNLLFELDSRNSSSWSGSGSTWYDTTSNNHDFTLVNGPTNTTVGGVTAIDFDGTNDYASVGDISAFPHGTSNISIEFYVYVDDLNVGGHAANVRYIFSKTSPSNQHITFGFTMSSSNVNLFTGSNAGGNMSETYNLGAHSNVEGAWHHGVMTFDGSYVKMYWDGSLVYTSSSGKQMGNNTADLRIMTHDPSNGSWGNWVNGKLAVMRVYTDVLTASEVTNNRANCTGGAVGVDSVLTVTPTSHQGSAFTATFTFDQNVGLFDTNDVTVSGGSKGTFTAVSKKVYTLAITPSGNSNVTITVPESASFNAASLDNNAINLTVTYSTFTTSGLVCHLNANDSSSYGGSGSTWTDLSSSSNNGTIYGATFNSTGVKSFTFDGSNDYVEVTRMIGASSFSLAAWINTTSHSGSGGSGNFWGGTGIIDTEQGGSGDFGLVVKNGSAGFGVGNNTTIWSSPGSYPVTDGDWHYIVGTRNASTGEIILYVDGSQAAQNSTSGGTGALTDTSTIRIGRTYSGASYYSGKIAEVHIYNDVLTSSEVSTNYNDSVGTYYTPVLTLANSSHNNAQFTLTMNWNTNVTGFTSSDITVTNASKGTFSGSGKTYTLVLTPTGQTTINFQISANAVTRSGGSEQNAAVNENIIFATWPEADLLLWYDFDTNALSGTTAINSKGTNGSISHSTYSMVTANPGHVDFSPQSNGGGITCPTISASDLNADWTAAFWIKYDIVNQGSWGSNRIYFVAGTGSTRQMVELSTKYGGLSCAFYNDDHESDGKVGAGVWHYCVYRYDYSTRTIEFFADIGNLGSGTAGGTVTVSSSNAPRLAGNPFNLSNNGFDGKISQFQFYDKKITDEEMELAYAQHKSAYHGSLPSTPTFAHIAQDYSGSGTTQNASVGSNTITWSNSPTFVGNAWDIDSNEYGTLASPVDNNGNGTFMCWCRPDSNSSSTIFAHGGSGTGGFQFRFNGDDGKLEILRHWTASEGKSSTGNSLTSGNLYCVGYTRSGNTITFFVNGSSDGSYTQSASFSHSTNRIGGAHNGENFRGQIYSWAYWDNTVLSNSNISDIYDIGPTMGLIS